MKGKTLVMKNFTKVRTDEISLPEDEARVCWRTVKASTNVEEDYLRTGIYSKHKNGEGGLFLENPINGVAKKWSLHTDVKSWCIAELVFPDKNKIPNITSFFYSRLVSKGNYENEQLKVEVQLEEGQSFEEELKKTRELVEKRLNDDLPF